MNLYSYMMKKQNVSFTFLFLFLIIAKKVNDNKEVFKRFNLSC
jgi:hypothetical protein